MRKIAVVDRKICVACGACAKGCPRGALAVYRGGKAFCPMGTMTQAICKLKAHEKI